MLIYLLLMNALGFAVMLLDKFFAKNKMRRIPEATLMGIAVIGGSAGCLCGMYTVRHKTRHVKFTVGIPIIMAVQLAIAAWYYLP